MGSSIALKAFAASIIGGFGDVIGAIVGGLALGVVETFGAAYISVPFYLMRERDAASAAPSKTSGFSLR
jgi:branched-subunit amino acid ABC-type transport system permease component